ncbi:hypothetical protein [Bacillus toyonensis]|uniref:hypothetical protein n=1 Tax=Bacillus toyonensis TaxID=155322 RepID=UPI002E1B00C0|nr:hypothetical protein [Bacillus toyonensis]
MSLVFKQLYEVRFNIGKGAYIGCNIVLEDKPLIDVNELQGLAIAKLNKIYFAFDVILKEAKFEQFKLIKIDDKDNPNYRVAEWLFKDGRESVHITWSDFADGIIGADVDESEVEYAEAKDMLKILELIKEL